MTTAPPKPTPICQCGCQKQDDDVKWFALVVRRGLLTIVREIERKYDVGERKDKAA